MRNIGLDLNTSLRADQLRREAIRKDLKLLSVSLVLLGLRFRLTLVTIGLDL